MKTQNRRRLAYLMSTALLAPGLAYAQDATTPSQAEASSTLDDIIVTAQKKQESLQNVPISVDVVGGETLDRLSLSNFDELSGKIPNFSVRKSGSTSLISIRGIGSGGDRGFEQSVGMFVDGVFAGRDQQFAVPFFDLARVEVLKGPQSILFGKNTIAGAVNITTAGPTTEPRASLTAEYETEARERVLAGYVSGPLTETLRGRLAARVSRNDGYLFNTLTNRDERTSEDALIRASVEWEPRDTLRVNAKYEHGDVNRVGSPFQLLSFGAYKNVLTAFDPKIEDRLDRQSSSGRFLNDAEEIQSDNFALEVDKELGDFVLTAVTGYSSFDTKQTNDADGTSIPLIAYRQSEEFRQFSQELRLESPVSDRFEYTLGAFYQRGTYFTDPRLDVDGSLLGTVKVASQRTFDQTSTIWSAFAEGKWHLNDAFTVVGGLRYTNEDKSAFKQNTVLKFGTQTPETSPMVLAVSKAVLGSVNFSADLDRSESNLSPSLALQYGDADRGMAYFKVTQGFKSGGFDVADQSGLSLEYQGEEATAYELGWKTRLADNRAEVNLAIFRTDFEDLQVSAFDGVRFLTTNAAAARSQGVEVNGRWQITPALYFTGSAAYTDATYQNYTGAVCTAEQKAAFTGPGSCLQDLSGRPLFASSRWSSNVNLEHVAGLPNGLTLQSNLGVNYRSKHYLATDLAEASLQDGYASVDAGVAVVSESNRWRAGLVVKNLTDERAMGYVMNVPIFSGARVASIIPPRTFGFSVTVNY